MPKITVPQTPSIADQILALPINSAVGVRALRDTRSNTFTDVALRTGENGWVTARDHGITDLSLVPNFSGLYLNNRGMRAWIARFGDDVDFYHLTGE